jgi:plastocyanin
MVTVAHATTHIIQFGGSFGLHYSPNSLNVSVGDTIRWEGDFSMHPLSSTTIPVGGQSFHQTSGSVFSYSVIIAGTYLYQCDFHVGLGMTGSFSALLTGVENIQTSFQPDAFRLKQNFPNPFNPTTMISFDIPFQTTVSLKIYNLIGQEVATIANENMPAGSYSKMWNAISMSSGIYYYRLQAGAYSETKKLVLLK